MGSWLCKLESRGRSRQRSKYEGCEHPHEVGDHQPLPVLGSKGRNHPKEQTAVKDGKGHSGSRTGLVL